MPKKVALAVASSGIAARLLPGRTGHSRFKIPFHLLSTSTCNIPLGSEDAKLIQASELILWDECPMQDRMAFEALDRSLRDIMSQVDPYNAKFPFGNKLIFFGGDFRPVVKKGRRGDIVNASFKRSPLLRHVIVLPLRIQWRRVGHFLGLASQNFDSEPVCFFNFNIY
jgi:ATP-dependent DNA helicase PIF1